MERINSVAQTRIIIIIIMIMIMFTPHTTLILPPIFIPFSPATQPTLDQFATHH
ncbi:hypothetical protein EX30DRAFT_340909 [Ascodesmis nigricans]|uniref:Uncharacterized protein n=1 Tax=Ascodesmis nigricans TaxID=341454 RepID=A0A4S2MXI2_9PEZI|nr:hypothetical protein EX30DRAFT_340909 [Ascodesmis nigricans]